MEKKRKTKQQKLIEVAAVTVPKTSAHFAKLTALLKFNPTSDQKEQIVKTVRGYFEAFEQAYNQKETPAAPGTFNLVA